MIKKYALVLVLVGCLSANTFAIKPQKEYVSTPESKGMIYKELQLTTTDNYQINTWVMRPGKMKDNKTVIVLAYGDAMNMSYWVEQCYSFVQEGFTVVTFDYRGFGASSPFAIDTNQLYYDEYATDLSCVLTYAKKEFKGYKVGIRAMSMGTIIGTLVCNESPVDFFVGEGFVSDPIVMQGRLKKKTGRTFRIPESARNYKQVLSEEAVPMLVFSGTADKNTPLVDSKAIVDGHPKRKLVTYNGGHMEGMEVLSGPTLGSEYIGEIKKFLRGS